MFNLFKKENGSYAEICNVETNENVIALTFDIGWGEERPPQVLDCLAQLHIKDITFFLSGVWVANHPEVFGESGKWVLK